MSSAFDNTSYSQFSDITIYTNTANSIIVAL